MEIRKAETFAAWLDDLPDLHARDRVRLALNGWQADS